MVSGVACVDGKQGLQATACLQRQQAFTQKLKQLQDAVAQQGP